MTRHETFDSADAKALGHDDIMRLVREAGNGGFQKRAHTAVHPDSSGFKARDFQQVESLPPEAPVFDEPATPAMAPVAEPQVSAQPAQVQPAHIDIEAIRAEAFEAGKNEGMIHGLAQGRAEGRIQGETEANQKILEARAAFEAVTANLSTLTAGDISTLTATVTDAINALASQRAGTVIEEMPENFVARVEALADRVAQGVRQVTVRLNADDLAAIEPYLEDSELLSENRIVADGRLGRGDVDVRAGAITLSDILNVGSRKAGA